MRYVTYLPTPQRTTGDAIKHARTHPIVGGVERSKWSHDFLGAKVGTSRQHLIRLEKNVHRPQPDMLQRIATATGYDLDFFTGAAKAVDPNEDDEESDMAGHLLLALRQIIAAEVNRRVVA